MNQEDWINNGDEPAVIDASMLSYVVGDDADDPVCELLAAPRPLRCIQVGADGSRSYKRLHDPTYAKF